MFSRHCVITFCINMSINNPKHHRRSIRLPEYDYSQEGVYYITICTQDRRCLFGGIINGRVKLSEYGKIAERFWRDMTEYCDGILLDTFVIMPNHMHAIIVIIGDVIRRGEVASPLGGTVDISGKPGDGIEIPGEVTSPLRGTGKHTLGQILAFYKYQTTKSINAIKNTPGNKIWQRNYWEHVIRNEKSLHKIRGYIRDNPWHWASDDENPERKIISRGVRAIHELPQQ